MARALAGHRVKRPLFPSLADSPDGQRLLTAVRELMSIALNTDSPNAPLISCPTGTVAQLHFGVLNRVYPPYGGYLSLPKIDARTVNTPLYVAKGVPSGVVKTIPIGKGLTGVTAFLNGSPSGITRVAAGLQIFLQDGVNWWAT